VKALFRQLDTGRVLRAGCDRVGPDRVLAGGAVLARQDYEPFARLDLYTPQLGAGVPYTWVSPQTALVNECDQW
jgi:hypothetical protein